MLIRHGNLKIPFILLRNVVIRRPIYISLEFTVELQKNNISHRVDEV